MAGSAIRRPSLHGSVHVAAAFTAILALQGTEIARAEDNPVSAVLFGSLDAGPSAFATIGAKIAFDRIDREGFAVLASAGAGIRSERGPASATAPMPVLMRWTTVGAALAGYQWFSDWGVVALFVGPEGTMEALSDAGIIRPLPARFGLRLHGEVWARPTDETMVTATLILGSARGDLWGRLSYGVRMWGAYLGPEVALYADGTGYRKWSFGLHATDVAIGETRLRISAGYLTEGEAGGSPYVAVSAWHSF